MESLWSLADRSKGWSPAKGGMSCIWLKDGSKHYLQQMGICVESHCRRDKVIRGSHGGVLEDCGLMVSLV